MKDSTKKLRINRSPDERFGIPPDPDELITVFATHKDDVRDCGTARQDPFMPSAKHGNKKSCFRIKELQPRAIWKIAEEHVLSDKIKKIYGRLDVQSSVVYQHRLNFDPDNTPRRHANIVAWPDDKQAQKSLAQQIAAESVFHCQLSNGSLVAEVSYDKKNRRLYGVVDLREESITFHSMSIRGLGDAMRTALRERNSHP